MSMQPRSMLHVSIDKVKVICEYSQGQAYMYNVYITEVKVK